MSDPTYRIPTTGLYLEADGTLVPAPKAGAAVIDASEAMAANLTAAYVGKGLQLMSNTGGNAAGGEPTRNALKELGEWAEGIVLVGDIVELGLKIGEFMGLFPNEKDPVMVKLEALDAYLNAIDDLVLASWASSRRDQLAILRAHSSAPLRVVQEYLELNRPQTPVWASKIAQADYNSLFACQVFTQSGLDGGYWVRPFSPKAIGLNQASALGPTTYTSTWANFHPDRVQITTNPGGPVWDYRFALPAMLYAVISRIAVLKAVAPRSLQRGEAGCREIRGYVRFLRAVVQRIQDGMWAIQGLPTDPASRFQFAWSGYAPVAAAQMHSGYSFVRVLYAYELEGLRAADPVMWPAGLVEPLSVGNLTNDQRWELGNENVRKIGAHWWHLIWRDIGMLDLCRIIPDIERACTQPVFSRWIGEAQKILTRASSDETSRSQASLANGLTRLTSSGDPAADSVRTFRLYQALRSENAAVQGVLTRATEELLSFAPELEQPAPVHAAPADDWWRAEDNHAH
jgi:hypothetical protein